MEDGYLQELLNDGEENVEKLHSTGTITDEEYEEYKANKGEAKDLPTDGDETPSTEEASSDGEGTTPVDTEANLEDAKQWQAWVKAFSDDPVNAIASIVGNPQAFTPAQRNMLAQYLSPTAAQSEVPQTSQEFASLEPYNEFEAAIIPHGDWITNGRNEVSQAFGMVEDNLRQLYIEQQIQLATFVEVSKLFLGEALPEVNLEEIYKAKTIGDGIKAHTDKVRKLVDKQRGLNKATAKPTPTTIKSGGHGDSGFNAPKSMQEAYKQVEAMLKGI